MVLALLVVPAMLLPRMLPPLPAAADQLLRA
jgi:hypothetical protein